MTCKGYKTKCPYYKPKQNNLQQCKNYNRQIQYCKLQFIIP